MIARIFFIFCSLVFFKTQSYGASQEFINTFQNITEERISFYSKIFDALTSQEQTFEEKTNLLTELLDSTLLNNIVGDAWRMEQLRLNTDNINRNITFFKTLTNILNFSDSKKNKFENSAHYSPKKLGSSQDDRIDTLINLVYKDRDLINNFSAKTGTPHTSIDDIKLEYIYLLSQSRLIMEEIAKSINFRAYLSYMKEHGLLHSIVDIKSTLEIYSSRPIHSTQSLKDILNALTDVLGPERTVESKCFISDPYPAEGELKGNLIPGEDHAVPASLRDQLKSRYSKAGPYQKELERITSLISELDSDLTKPNPELIKHVNSVCTMKTLENPLCHYLGMMRKLHLCRPIKSLNVQIKKVLKDIGDHEKNLAKAKRIKNGKSNKNNKKKSDKNPDSSSIFSIKDNEIEKSVSDIEEITQESESGSQKDLSKAAEGETASKNMNSETSLEDLERIRLQNEDEEERRYKQWFARWLWKEGYTRDEDEDFLENRTSSISFPAFDSEDLASSAASDLSAQKIQVGRGRGIWISKGDKELLEVFAGPWKLKNFKYRFEEFETLCKRFNGRISKGRTTGDHIALVLPDPEGRIFKAGSFHPSSPKMPAIVFDHFMKAFKDAGYLDEHGKVIQTGL